MKMRKTETYLFGGLFAALLLVSCSSEDTTPHSTPPALGKITLDQSEDIRPGQWVTASIPLPAGGENIRSMEKSWTLETYLGTKESTEKDGKDILGFNAPSTAGKYAITYSVNCIYEGTNSIGLHMETLTANASYEVVKTDIFSSKWTDTPQITLRAYPVAEKTNDDTQCVMDAKDVLSSVESKTIKRYFLHENDILREIKEIEDIEMDGSESDENCYRLMYRNRVAAKFFLQMEYGESYAIDAATGNKITDIPLEEASSADMKEYTRKLYSGELEKVCFMLSDDVTNLVITGRKSVDGIRISRSYTKK